MRLNHPGFSRALVAIVAVAAIWSVWELFHSRWAEAAALAGVSALSAAALRFRHRLASLFGLLLALAALVNAGGYVLTLWHQQSTFDEAAHFFTSFAGVAAIGWALAAKTSRFGSGLAMLFLSLLAIGLAIGAAWELFEWLIGIIGSRRDTLIDLAMDAAGTIAAGALSVWIAARRH